MDDRRKHPRVPLISIARLTRQGLQEATTVLVRDISTHGLGIYSEEAYQNGDLVLIEFSLTAGDETVSESIMGEVVWIAPLPDKAHHAVGIRFDRMMEEKPKLYAHIKHLEEIG